MPPSDFASNLRVVLVDSRNPLNMGAAARAMSNFGFFHLRVVHPYEAAWREARSAVNAAEVLKNAEEFPNTAEAISDCGLVIGTTAAAHRELQHTLLRLEHAAPVIREALAAGPVALLFGSEKFGLSNQDLSYCHSLLRIPTRAGHGSMNLGQAVAVCLYELIRTENTREPEPRSPASSADVERLAERLEHVLTVSGYPQTTSSPESLRRLVRRMDLSARDAVIWLGMLRQIGWKLGAKRDDILMSGDES